MTYITNSNKKIKILHIVSEMTIRGGENQIKHLVAQGKENLDYSGTFQHFVACPENSDAIEVFSDLCPTYTFKKSPLKVSSASQISKIIKELEISAIDCHSSHAHTLGILVKLRFKKLKLIVHRRVDNKPSSNIISKFKYKSYLVDSFVAISDAIKKVLVGYGVDSKKISVVKSAVNHKAFENIEVDLAKSNLRKELNISEKTKIICNVGYLTKQKDHKTLLKSLYELKKTYPLFHCIVAGDGALLKGLKSLCKQLELESQVTFLGFRKDIPKLLSASDIYLMPSSNEGLGTSIIDAIHCNLPVVATRVGGIPELVIPGKTGFLSDSGDFKNIAKNLNTLLNDDYLAKEYSQNARKIILPNFTIEAMAKGNHENYRKLLLTTLKS